MEFYVPPYLADDFDDCLDDLGDSCTLNYNASTPTAIKVLTSSLDFKSNMKGLSDNTKDIKVSLSSGLKKGDYITDADGGVYLVNWQPMKSKNCLSAQMQYCSYSFDFERWQYAQFDSVGVATTPAGFVDVAVNVKGYTSRVTMLNVTGREGSIGTFQTQRIMVGIQYNSNTSPIKVSDEFDYYSVRYIITDIDMTQINLSGVDGILIIYAQVKEGGNSAD